MSRCVLAIAKTKTILVNDTGYSVVACAFTIIGYFVLFHSYANS